jgi:hypothetical protein
MVYAVLDQEVPSPVKIKFTYDVLTANKLNFYKIGPDYAYFNTRVFWFWIGTSLH